jgi:hypothetical protein
MRAMLSRVGLNELLDSVRHYHSDVPDLSPLTLSFNVPNASGASSDQRINAQCWRGLRAFKLHLHSTSPEPLKRQDD